MISDEPNSLNKNLPEVHTRIIFIKEMPTLPKNFQIIFIHFTKPCSFVESKQFYPVCEAAN